MAMVIEALKNLHGPSRRRFLRWAGAVGALLALDRARFLDVMGGSAGTAMADEAACSLTNKSVHIVAGDGGFAWFQLLWPHVAVATANNDNFAFHRPGQAILATETDNPLYYAPEAPWQSYDKSKRVTALMAGSPVAHDPTPLLSATVGNNQSMLAVCAAIQRATPSLLPVIAVNPLGFGTAPGAPTPTAVGSADGLVELFNSAASRQILQLPEDASHYEAYYKALLGLNAAAARPTQLRGLRVGKQSANFLGKNLSDKLRVNEADELRYGIDAGTPTKLSEIARTLIIAVKAFKLGLTQSVILPAMRDDPHGAFGDMDNLNSTVAMLGKILDEFMNDLAATPDPSCTARNLSDNVIITVHGDTPKTPLQREGWPDGTPNGSNWVYVMGNGMLKTGWFGGVKTDGNTDGFDPTTGATIQNQAATVTSAPAGAAVAYAVAKGDMRRVEDFYAGPSIEGIVNINPIQ
jgi:hypothetical protein